MTVDSAFPIGYFYIISQLNGLALDVNFRDAKDEQGLGASIVMMQKKLEPTERDSQLWIHQSGYLTNKKTGLVLDVNRSKHFKDIFTKAHQLNLGMMKEQEGEKETSDLCSDRKSLPKANDQQFGFEEATGYIYTLEDPQIVFDIRKAEIEENTEVMVFERKSEDNENQLWTIELADPPKADAEDDTEEGVSAGLQAWFGQWLAWGSKKKDVLKEKKLEEAHEKAYKQKKVKLSHQLLAGAAAFEAVKQWESKKEENGETVEHGTAKEVIAAIAAAELVKLVEERKGDEEEEVTKKPGFFNAKSAATTAAIHYYESKYLKS